MVERGRMESTSRSLLLRTLPVLTDDRFRSGMV